MRLHGCWLTLQARRDLVTVAAVPQAAFRRQLATGSNCSRAKIGLSSWTACWGCGQPAGKLSEFPPAPAGEAPAGQRPALPCFRTCPGAQQLQQGVFVAGPVQILDVRAGRRADLFPQRRIVTRRPQDFECLRIITEDVSRLAMSCAPHGHPASRRRRAGHMPGPQIPRVRTFRRTLDPAVEKYVKSLRNFRRHHAPPPPGSRRRGGVGFSRWSAWPHATHPEAFRRQLGIEDSIFG